MRDLGGLLITGGGAKISRGLPNRKDRGAMGNPYPQLPYTYPTSTIGKKASIAPKDPSAYDSDGANQSLNNKAWYAAKRE